MKTIIFLLLPLFAIAQIDTISNPIDTTTTPIDTIPEPPIVVNPPTPIPNGLAKDTIYSKVIDGYFYIVRRNVQDNGSYTETSEFVGDTTALIDRAEGIIVQNSDVLYKSALLVLSSAKYWDQAIRDDQLLTFAYGQSPLTQIQQSYDGQFLNGVWAMQTAQGTQQVGFSRDAVGKLKLILAEEEKTVHLVGNCMRIEGLFPTGPVNLYKVSQGLWVNTEKTIAIKQVQ